MACNGTEVKNVWTCGRERNERWLHLAAEHARNAFHLLPHGGDQLYADALWHDVPAFAEWRQQSWRHRRKASFIHGRPARDFFWNSYCHLWSQPELAPILSSVPSLMMWDDHDIIDGWGSYAADWLESPLFQGLWSAAREHFALFQLATHPHDLPEGLTDRRGNSSAGPTAWARSASWLRICAPGNGRANASWARRGGAPSRQASSAWRTAAMSSSPACRWCTCTFMGSNGFGHIPGHQEWQDDLIDQWPSLAHWDEWTCLLRTLLGFSAERRVQVTSLSGEIHLGSWGRSRAARRRFTSSPLQASFTRRHRPWPSPCSSGLAPSRCSLPSISQRDCYRCPGRRFLRARNWLEIEFTAAGDLAATWHGVGATSRLTIPGAHRSDRSEDDPRYALRPRQHRRQHRSLSLLRETLSRYAVADHRPREGDRESSYQTDAHGRSQPFRPRCRARGDARLPPGLLQALLQG